jgi:hypothetical protein
MLVYSIAPAILELLLELESILVGLDSVGVDFDAFKSPPPFLRLAIFIWIILINIQNNSFAIMKFTNFSLMLAFILDSPVWASKDNIALVDSAVTVNLFCEETNITLGFDTMRAGRPQGSGSTQGELQPFSPGDPSWKHLCL